jgi:hypothetical protein
MGLKKMQEGYYAQIPEEIVKQSADFCKEDENNGFIRVWRAGQEYKSAGMTPIYLLDQSLMQLIVVAAETFGKKLN